MIRHIVFFTICNEANRQAVQDGLALLKDIPHAEVLEVGINRKTDEWSSEIDFVVYGEFADEAALAAYKAHPLYQKSIEIVRPLRDSRIAADFDATTSKAGKRSHAA